MVTLLYSEDEQAQLSCLVKLCGVFIELMKNSHKLKDAGYAALPEYILFYFQA
jgi:hypothetical protein